MSSRQVMIWLGLAFCLRLIPALTTMSFYTPDEWYQTAEYANLMQNGFMTSVLEVAAHLRNLSVSELLRVPLALADAAAPGNPYAHIVFIKLFVGALDLLVTVWFVRTLLFVLGPNPRWLPPAVVASFVLPYTFYGWTVRTSTEHFAALVIMALTAINWRELLRAREPTPKWVDAATGCLFVLLGAIRYPALLYSVGAGGAWLWQLRHQRAWPRVLAMSAGVSFGVVVFGLADLAYYGRPWESFWMYAQYNVFTGLAAATFGKQGVAVYGEHLWDQLGNGLVLWGLAVLFGAAYGFSRALREGAVWAWGAAVFFLGHLFVAHKEGRFLAPLFPLLFAAAAFGWRDLSPRLSRFWARSGVGVRRGFVACVGITLVFNLVGALETLRGHLFKGRHEYFLAVNLARRSGACALASLTEIPSVFLSWRPGEPVPGLATAHFDLGDGGTASPQPKDLTWIDRQPACSDSGRVFFHVRWEEPLWEARGCSRREFYDSAWLRVVANWAKGTALYDCPAAVLEAYPDQQLEVLTHALPHLPSLPPFGTPGQVMLDALPRVPGIL